MSKIWLVYRVYDQSKSVQREAVMKEHRAYNDKVRL